MEAVHALASGREVVVVASARALVRALPPAGSDVHVPVALSAGRELAAMPGAQAASVTEFEDFAHALEERGYRNTGELDGPGTFAVRGGTIDVFPGNLVYPVRLDFFGDELEEIRRIVPTTGQTIQALPDVSIYPVVEFSCPGRGSPARARSWSGRPRRTPCCATCWRSWTAACASTVPTCCCRTCTRPRPRWAITCAPAR